MFRNFMADEGFSPDQLEAAVMSGNRFCAEDPKLGRLVMSQVIGMHELIKYCHEVGYKPEDWENINHLMAFHLFRLAEEGKPEGFG